MSRHTLCYINNPAILLKFIYLKLWEKTKTTKNNSNQAKTNYVQYYLFSSTQQKTLFPVLTINTKLCLSLKQNQLLYFSSLNSLSRLFRHISGSDASVDAALLPGPGLLRARRRPHRFQQGGEGRDQGGQDDLVQNAAALWVLLLANV